MTVAVILVNRGPLLRQCLESLERQRRPPDHVIVVDNASTDDSLRQADHARAPEMSRASLNRIKPSLAFVFRPWLKWGHGMVQAADDSQYHNAFEHHVAPAGHNRRPKTRT
jgi:glycosyltransferase involved in cell wall biosynthesis